MKQKIGTRTLAIVSAIISLFAALSSVGIWFVMKMDIVEKNRPLVIVTEERARGKEFKLTLWNVGPGIAYDLQVISHLVRPIYEMGAVSRSYAADVVTSALQLATPDPDEQNAMDLKCRGFRSPPIILPVGKDIGYIVDDLTFLVMESVFLLLSYKDALENVYYSRWTGVVWEFGEGYGSDVPDYRYGRPHTGYYAHGLRAAEKEALSKRRAGVAQNKERYFTILAWWVDKEIEFISKLPQSLFHYGITYSRKEGLRYLDDPSFNSPMHPAPAVRNPTE